MVVDSGGGVVAEPSAPSWIKEIETFLKNSAPNGAVINGALLWMDIQRKSATDQLWRQQALSKFVDGEIVEAKNALWSIIDEEIVGRNIPRKGDSKIITEINDIAQAMKKLDEAGKTPLFMATSTMVKNAPIMKATKEVPDIGDVVNNVKVLEDSMNSFMVNQSAKMDSLALLMNSFQKAGAQGSQQQDTLENRISDLIMDHSGQTSNRGRVRDLQSQSSSSRTRTPSV